MTKLLFTLLLLGTLGLPQGPKEGTAASQKKPATTLSTTAVDPQRNADVVKLFDLNGERERIQSTLPQALKDAGAKMLQVLPGSDPAYFEEWARRMASALNVQDIIDEEVHVYE